MAAHRKLHKFVDGKELKQCCRCDGWKELSFFHKEQRRRDGLDNRCKQCSYKRGRAYRILHPQLWRRDAQKKRDAFPPGAYAAKMKEYRIKHPDRIHATQEKHCKRPINMLSHRLSSNIRQSLNQGKQGRSWESMVGYTAEELKSRLLKTMPKGYTWDDLEKLHIDHIIPISAFNVEDETSIDFKRCWALKNLQLLPVVENLVKNAKLYRPFQPSLAISENRCSCG